MAQHQTRHRPPEKLVCAKLTMTRNSSGITPELADDSHLRSLLRKPSGCIATCQKPHTTSERRKGQERNRAGATSSVLFHTARLVAPNYGHIANTTRVLDATSSVLASLLERPLPGHKQEVGQGTIHAGPVGPRVSFSAHQGTSLFTSY